MYSWDITVNTSIRKGTLWWRKRKIRKRFNTLLGKGKVFRFFSWENIPLEEMKRRLRKSLQPAMHFLDIEIIECRGPNKDNYQPGTIIEYDPQTIDDFVGQRKYGKGNDLLDIPLNIPGKIITISTPHHVVRRTKCT